MWDLDHSLHQQRMSFPFRDRLLDALRRTPEAELRAHQLTQSSVGAYAAATLLLDQLCLRLADQHAKNNKVPLVNALIFKYGVVPMSWEATPPLEQLYRALPGPCAPVAPLVSSTFPPVFSLFSSR